MNRKKMNKKKQSYGRNRDDKWGVQSYCVVFAMFYAKCRST